ncbi:hypothetical protein D3C76_1739350 [compost metagenome]
MGFDYCFDYIIFWEERAKSFGEHLCGIQVPVVERVVIYIRKLPVAPTEHCGYNRFNPFYEGE